jgi:hypothetical protein
MRFLPPRQATRSARFASASRLSTTALALVLFLSSCTGSTAPTTGHPVSLAPLPGPTSAPPTPKLATLTWKPQIRVSFDFDEGVSSSDKALIRSSIKQARGLFPYPHLRLVRPALVAVFVHKRNGEMTRPNEIAEVRRQSVHVFVGGDGWKNSDALQRREAMFHEWVHIVQQLESPFRPGPVWLVEGSAEWAAWDAIFRLHLASRSTIGHMLAQIATGVDPDRKLKEMEGQNFYRHDPDGRDYALAYTAVESLDPSRGWRTIIAFYRALGNGDLWQTAFRRAFKTSVTRFYRSFEASRASGFAG